MRRVLHLMSNFSNYCTGKTHLADIMKTFSSYWLINDILTTDTSESLFYFLNECLQGIIQNTILHNSILLFVLNTTQYTAVYKVWAYTSLLGVLGGFII